MATSIKATFDNKKAFELSSKCIYTVCQTGRLIILTILKQSLNENNLSNFNRILQRLRKPRLDNLSKLEQHLRGCDFNSLYKVLIETDFLPPPKNGWGKKLDERSIEISDDVERLHHIRNKLSHLSKLEVADLEEHWHNLLYLTKRIDEEFGRLYNMEHCLHSITCNLDEIFNETSKPLPKSNKDPYRALDIMTEQNVIDKELADAFRGVITTLPRKEKLLYLEQFTSGMLHRDQDKTEAQSKVTRKTVEIKCTIIEKVQSSDGDDKLPRRILSLELDAESEHGKHILDLVGNYISDHMSDESVAVETLIDNECHVIGTESGSLIIRIECKDNAARDRLKKKIMNGSLAVVLRNMILKAGMDSKKYNFTDVEIVIISSDNQHETLASGESEQTNLQFIARHEDLFMEELCPSVVVDHLAARGINVDPVKQALREYPDDRMYQASCLLASLIKAGENACTTFREEFVQSDHEFLSMEWDRLQKENDKKIPTPASDIADDRMLDIKGAEFVLGKQKRTTFQLPSTGSYRAQSAVPTCYKHDKEKIDMFCRTCGERVCEKCAKNEHKTHDWTRSDKEGVAIKRDAFSRSKKARQLIADMKRTTTTPDIKESIERVRNRETVMIDIIKELSDNLVCRLENERSKSESINALDTIAKFFEEGIKFAHENVIVEMEEEFRQIVSQSESTITKSTERKLRFIEGNIVKETLEFMLGEVREDTVSGTGDQSHVMVTELSSFTHGTEFIYSLNIISDVEAWIYSFLSKSIERVNKDGKQISEIDTHGCGNFTVIDNDHVYTAFADKKIRRVSPSGVITDITSTAPLRPRGICTARTGGLLVCVCIDDTDQINQDSYGEVLHLEMNGKLLRKYPDHSDDQSKLFTCPDRITQNINLDLCVVDLIATDFTSRLVVVGVNGKKRWKYRGLKSLEEKFSCDSVACDYQGRILLTDLDNHAVHLLNSDGAFLQLLLTEQSGLWAPRSLDVRGDKLWVGCQEGVIKVYMYNI